jgi:hypothetical protein
MAHELALDHRDVRKLSPQLETASRHQANAPLVSLEQDGEQHVFAEARRLAHRVLDERRTNAAAL